MAAVRELLEAQIAEGEATIAREGVEIEGLTVLHSADMQFQGQSHILTVPLAELEVTREALQQAFEAAYWSRFEVELPEIRAVLVNLNTAVIGRRKGVPLEALAPTARARPRPRTRRVWFDGAGGRRRSTGAARSPPGTALEGPAIVEQLDTTTVVEPGDRVDGRRPGQPDHRRQRRPA